MALAGYKLILSTTLAPVVTTGEAMAQISGQLYGIVDEDKEIWDPRAPLVILDDGSPVDDEDIEEIDYLFGRVRFASTYSVDGPVTADLSYLPRVRFARSHDLDITRSKIMLEDSEFGDEHQKRGGGQKNTTISVDRRRMMLEPFSGTTDIVDYLDGRLCCLEYDPDPSDSNILVLRMLAIAESVEDTSAVEGAQANSVSFSGTSERGSVDAQGNLAFWSWG